MNNKQRLPLPDAVRREQIRLSDEEIARGEYEPVVYPFPSSYPGQWMIADRNDNGVRLIHLVSGLRVIASVMRERDGRRWLHVSFSHPDKLPSYREMCDVKRVIIGAEKFAYSIFSPESQHVNDHDYCLHLWHCLDAESGGSITPDFRRGGTI